MSRTNVVWIAPSATTFSCLCEACLSAARGEGLTFLDTVRIANVRGTLALEAGVGVAHCPAGHGVVIRRVDTPPKLAPRNARQLQLV